MGTLNPSHNYDPIKSFELQGVLPKYIVPRSPKWLEGKIVDMGKSFEFLAFKNEVGRKGSKRMKISEMIWTKLEGEK